MILRQTIDFFGGLCYNHGNFTSKDGRKDFEMRTSTKRIRKLTLHGLLLAIIFVWGLTYGYIPAFTAVTLTHIPVFIGCLMLNDTRSAILCGTAFGITSFLRCFTSPDVFAMVVLGMGESFGMRNVGYILALLILPRVLAGLFCCLSAKLIAGFAKGNRAVEVVSYAVGAAIGTLTNTVLFLGGFYLMAGGKLMARAFEAGFIAEASMGALLECLLGVAGSSGVFEAVIAVVVCTPAVAVLRPMVKRSFGEQVRKTTPDVSAE